MGEKKGLSHGIPLNEAGWEQHALGQRCISTDTAGNDPGGGDAHLDSRYIDGGQWRIGPAM